MLGTLLQLRATDGNLLLGLAAFALTFLSVGLSLVITVVIVRNYRRGPGRRGMLWLAVGLLLLTTVPELLRVVLPTFTGVDTVGQSVFVSLLELTGLGVILATIYGGRSG